MKIELYFLPCCPVIKWLFSTTNDGNLPVVFAGQNSTSWIEISKSSLAQSIQSFRKVCPQSLFYAVVKSNAYGHGLSQVVSCIDEGTLTDGYCVNSIEEALSLRKLTRKPVLVMGRARYGHDYGALTDAGSITCVLSTADDIHDFKQSAPGLSYHLKTDTGMSRLGIRPDSDKFKEVIEAAGKDPQWTGLMTHFANVEDVTDQSYANGQLNLFHTAVKQAQQIRHKNGMHHYFLNHAAASAAALVLPGSRMDMIRVGIMLYGLWASDSTRLSVRTLQSESNQPVFDDPVPAMSWYARVVHVNEVPAGTDVGYGCTSRTARKTRIAVLPVGYNEGYDRSLSNRAYVMIHGRRAMILGRVCMNMILVDVTDIEGVETGTVAALIGRSPGHEGEAVSADDLAELAGTINYEIVTRISEEIPRYVVS